MRGERCGYVLVPAAEVPVEEGFLSSAERARAAGLTVGPRRRDFVLGRYAARRALGAWLGVAPLGPEVEIAAAEDGAPVVRGLAAPAISLSHRQGWAACAVGRCGLALGVDVEWLEPRSDELIDQFFTAAEQAQMRRVTGAARALRANLVWSAKESAAKALREGLRLDTRSLEVELEEEAGALEGWAPLRVSTGEGGLGGWWRVEGSLVITVAAREPLEPPVRLVG